MSVAVGGDGTRKHGDRCRTSLFKHRGQGNKWGGEQRLNTQRCSTSSHQSRLWTIKSMFKLSLLKSLYFVNFTSVIHAQHIFGCFLQTDPRSLQGSQHEAPSRICGLLIINQQSGSIVRSNERLVCHFDFILYRSDWIDDFYQPDTRHNICIMLKPAQPSASFWHCNFYSTAHAQSWGQRGHQFFFLEMSTQFVAKCVNILLFCLISVIPICTVL